MRHDAVAVTLPMLSGGDALLGHAREFRDHRLAFLERAATEGADACRLRFFGKEFLFVNSPALLEEILVEHAPAFDKSFGMRTSLYPLTGEGLFTADGTLWRRQRRLMAPLFHPSSLIRHATAMGECARRVSERWVEGSEIDVGEEMTRIAMAIAGRVLFDLDMIDESLELVDALTTSLEWTSFAMSSFPLIVQQQLQAAVDDESRLPPFLQGLCGRVKEALRAPLLLPTARNREMQAAVRLLDQRVERMIAERRANRSERPDLLTRLIDARDSEDGGGMSDRQVRDEVLTLFVAGHETSATALAWTLYLLQQHQDACRRVEEEIASLPAEPDWERDLSRLAFTLRVIKESMRLYPPVYIFTRRAVKPVSIGGHDFPRGIEILISPYTLHRRADLWPDPLRFDPDRFLEAAEAGRARCAYLPFSVGPRVCIGQFFALLEIRVALAVLLSKLRFTFAGDAPAEPNPATTLRPGPMRARVSFLRSR